LFPIRLFSSLLFTPHHATDVGKEDAIVFGMGFGTNALGLSSLVGKGGLLVSDAQNHSSIVVGARASGR
jgi:serine palmitoyltransferase